MNSSAFAVNQWLCTSFLLFNHYVLQSEHLITNVVAYLVRLFAPVQPKFLSRLMFQNGLTLFVCTFILLTPLFMISYEWEQYLLITRLAIHL